MDIEILGTSAVEESLARTKYLRPYINTGDKEPSWDGNIYVYNHISCCKANLKGRVPVQVKGKKVKSISRNTISYSVQIADLKNYLRDGGIIYFIVYITSDCKKIYYSSLLPYDIKDIVKKAGKQKTISVQFEEFPDDEIEKTDLFLNFLKDRKLQGVLLTISDEDIKSLEAKENQEYTITFDTSNTNMEYPYEHLFDKSFYIYAKTDFGIKIPIKKASGIDSLKTKIQSAVYCGKKQYYDFYQVVKKKDSQEFCFGKGVSIAINKKQKTTQITYQGKGTLNQQIVDLAFFVNLVEAESAKLGEIIFPLKLDKEQSTDIAIFKEKLLYFQKVQRVLDFVGNKKELNVTSLEAGDWKKIDILIKVFIDKQLVKLTLTDEKTLLRLKIGNIGLILFSHRADNDKYRLSNIFKEKIDVCYNSEDEKNIELCLFCFFNKNDFLQASNLDYEKIYYDIIDVPGNKVYYNYVNALILQMLLAYDEGEVKDNDLLDCTIRLAEWLHSQTNGIIELLNYLQAQKRLRPLIKAELDKLHDLIENHNKSNSKYYHGLTQAELDNLHDLTDKHNMTALLLTGTYILLDDFSGAALHYDKLPIEKQEEFTKFPIYNLWKMEIPVLKK